MLYVEGDPLSEVTLELVLALCCSAEYCDGGTCCCTLLYDACAGTGFRCGSCCCVGFIIMVADIAPPFTVLLQCSYLV